MTPRWLTIRRRSAVALVAGVVLLSAAIRLLPPAYPTGDAASLSLHTIAALHGRQWLGPYSQFGWNHPGPLLFYLMASLYWLSGYHEGSHRVTALLVNGASLAGMLWLARRHVGVLFALVTAVTLVAFEWRAGGDMMFSAWNPHVTLLPLAALLFVSAAAWAGERRALPVAVVLASFVAQSHVGFVPIAGAALMMALLAALSDPDGRARRRVVTIAGSLGLLLWLPPLAEQVFDRPGNATRLVHYFIAGQTGARLSMAGTADLFAHYFVLLFQPHMRLPLGVAAETRASPTSLVAAGAIVVATLVACALAIRARRRFVAGLCGSCALTAVIAFVSVGSIRGVPADHMVFWISLIGTLSVLGLLGQLLTRVGPLRIDRVLGPTAWLIVASWLVLSSVNLVRWQHAASADRRTQQVWKAIDFEMRSTGATTARVQHTANSWAEVVGVVLQAEKHGRRLAVAPDLVHIAGDACAPTGREQIVFTVFDPLRDGAEAAGASRNVLRAGRLWLSMQPLPSR